MAEDGDSGEPLRVVGYAGLAYRQAKTTHWEAVTRDLSAYLWATLLSSMQTDRNRFNVLGEFGAVYFSLDAETPRRELERAYRKLLGVESSEDISAPRVLMTVAVSLGRVADLRDERECAAWGIAPAEVTADDLGPCQRVAREVRRTHEAIQYPSATGAGENLAVFYDRLLPASSVSLLELRALELP